jgi:hypothetical protein
MPAITSVVIGFALAAAVVAASVAAWPARGAGAAAISGHSASISRWKKDFTEVHQVAGCLLRGDRFGQIFVGGGVVYKGKPYRITDVAVRANRIYYTGLGVAATFTPDRGVKVLEHEDNDFVEPPARGAEPKGIVEIKVAGASVTLRGREDCVAYE